MNSTTMMMGLVGVYLLTAGVSAYELNWPRVLYWLSAASLTGSILWMQR